MSTVFDRFLGVNKDKHKKIFLNSQENNFDI